MLSFNPRHWSHFQGVTRQQRIVINAQRKVEEARAKALELRDDPKPAPVVAKPVVAPASAIVVKPMAPSVTSAIATPKPTVVLAAPIAPTPTK